MAGISISMNCPRCGGTLKFSEGAEMASCPYCSALLAIEGDNGIRRVMFRNAITREKAVQGVKDWWIDGSISYDVERKGWIEEPFLIYVPFWKLRATVVGLVCGKGDAWDRHAEERSREVMILEERELTQIACHPAGPGILRLENLEGETVPYETGAVPVFNVTTSEDEALITGLRTIENYATRDTRITKVTYRRVDTIPASLSILFYPVWIVNYTYHDRVYSATVDGITGTVLAGRAPESLFQRCFAMGLGMAAGGIGLPFLAWLVLTLPGSNGLPKHYAMDPDTIIPLVILTSVIILMIYLPLAHVIYSFFRKDADRTMGYVKDEYSMQDIIGNASGAAWNDDKIPSVQWEEHKL
jgi:hypothetical protein